MFVISHCCRQYSTIDSGNDWLIGFVYLAVWVCLCIKRIGTALPVHIQEES